MTSTSAAASASRSSGPSALGSDREVARRRARRRRARSEESLGVRRAASARRARGGSSTPRSGTRRRGRGRLAGWSSMIHNGRGLSGWRSMAILWLYRAIIQRMDAVDRQDSCAAGRGRAAHLRRHRRAGAACRRPSVKRRVDRLRARRARWRGSRRWSTTGRSGWDTEALVELFFRPGTTLDEVARDAARAPRGGRRRGASPARPTRSRGCGPRTTRDLERLTGGPNPSRPGSRARRLPSIIAVPRGSAGAGQSRAGL